MPVRSCLSCSYHSYCVRHTTIRLVGKHRLARCMWLNQYVEHHYRPGRMPPALCLRSALRWNNETLNIWSHLVGFLWLSLMQVNITLYALPALNAPLADHLVMSSSVACSQACMLFSTAYHLFGCHSPRWRERLLKLDLFGVSLALTGIYLGGIYLSFYNFPTHQRAYIAAMAIPLLAICAWAPRTTKLAHHHRQGNGGSGGGGKAVGNNDDVNDAGADENNDDIGGGGGCASSSPRRIGLLEGVIVALATLGLVPTWHWVALHGGIDSPHVEEWLPTLFYLFLYLGVGFIFYASLLPERLLPGKFDLFLSSHQLWHLFILIAIVYWHQKGVEMLHFYHREKAALIPNILQLHNGHHHQQPLYSPTIVVGNGTDSSTCYSDASFGNSSMRCILRHGAELYHSSSRGNESLN